VLNSDIVVMSILEIASSQNDNRGLQETPAAN